MTLAELNRILLLLTATPEEIHTSRKSYLELWNEVKSNLPLGAKVWLSPTAYLYRTEEYTPPTFMCRGVKIVPDQPCA